MNVLIALEKADDLPLETAVNAVIEGEQKDALVVPRNAALPSEQGTYELFTVKDGKAAKHEVTIGIQSGNEVEVKAEDLKAGDPVIVQGNYALQDKMQVSVESASTQPATAASREPEAKP